MQQLINAFAASAFGRTADGHSLFTPFGAAGTRYLLENPDTEIRLRRQVRAFAPLAALPMLSLLSLFVLPRSVREPVLVWIMATAGGSLVVFMAAYYCWSSWATRKMKPVDAELPFVPALFDSEYLAANELLGYLTRSGIRNTRCRETLTVLGSLAGFACQCAVRALASKHEQPSGLIEVALTDGRLLYFGDVLNAPLAEANPSIWSIVSDGADAAKLHGIFSEATSLLTASDGEHRFSEQVRALQVHWAVTVTILRRYGLPPELWNLAIARVATQLSGNRASLTSEEAAMTIMRAAIPMSKIDPTSVLTPQPETEVRR